MGLFHKETPEEKERKRTLKEIEERREEAQDMMRRTAIYKSNIAYLESIVQTGSDPMYFLRTYHKGCEYRFPIRCDLFLEVLKNSDVLLDKINAEWKSTLETLNDLDNKLSN